MHLFNFVKDIYNDPDNKDFAVWVQSLVLNGNNLPQDINEIRKALGLRGKQSINYSFVKEESVKMQLCVDNLRMENVILDLTLDDMERYTSFCVNAHLQVEGLLNYFYSVKHDNDIKAIIQEIKDATAGSGFTYDTNKWKSTAYTPSKDQENMISNVESIPVYNKLMAFYNRYSSLNPNVNLGYSYNNLDYTRKVRNNTFHRGIAPTEFKGKTYLYPDTIRKDLQLFVRMVQDFLK